MSEFSNSQSRDLAERRQAWSDERDDDRLYEAMQQKESQDEKGE